MNQHKYWTILFAAVLLIGCLMPASSVSAQAPPQKYAVLISTGRTTADDTWYHSEYWYDLVLTYKMLIENGFTHDHIYVLYGNGVDFVSAHADYQNPYATSITDYAVTRANVQNIFNWLATGNAAQGITALTNDDFLYVWWMGHGGGGASCNTSFSISTTSESVTDTELAAWSGAVSYRRRAFVFMTCHSGGAMDNLQNANTVTMPSCTCTQGSSSDTYDVVHGEWTYLVDGALQEVLPGGAAVASDADGNNLVSLQETFNWGAGQPMGSTPQLSDLGGIAPCTFIRLEGPGEDTEIYSRDHVNDDGTVPSNTQVWYHGPDLWVRHAQDGLTTHQNPEYGQTNYVYANVHNIGCSTVTNATVDFSWVQQSGWANPSSWNPIGTATIPSLASLSSTTVNVPWNSVPLPGDYCLHTRLNVTGDPENTDGRAYMDDNKVQINVTVEDNWSLATWHWYFFIENGGMKLVPIDLVLDTQKIPQGSVVRLELPPTLKFEDVEGAEVFEDEDGWIILEIPAGMKEPALVLGTQLEPTERQRAVLSIKLSEEVKPGEEATFTFEERVRGETTGGIQFVSRAAEPSVVMCNLAHEQAGVYRGLAKVAEIEEAAIVAEIQEKLAASGDCKDEGAFLEGAAEIAAVTPVIGERLTKVSPDYGHRYMRANERLQKALEERNLPAIVEAEQEMLTYASIVLSDLLTR